MPDVTLANAANAVGAKLNDLDEICYDRFVDGLAACGIADPDDVSASGVAVGVSGGPDSMALACMTRRWCTENDVPLRCFIVDHNLRDGSAAEAERVKGWLTRIGVAAEVLASATPPPTSDIQNEARKLRYALMLDRCRALGIRHLMVAHHQDDQAETFLLRLTRGSGVHGLSGMAPSIRLGGVRLLRPLLGIRREDLHRVLTASSWPSVQDPSNENGDFARVRIRNLMPLLAEEGLDARRLALTADAMMRARQAIERYVREFLADTVHLSELGHATLRRSLLAELPEEVGLRVVSHLAQRVGGRFYPPRIEMLEAAYRTVCEEEAFSGRTLAGCRLIADRNDNDVLLVCREGVGAASTRVPVRGHVHWDSRFEMEFDRNGLDFAVLEDAGYRIGALTRAGREWLAAELRGAGCNEKADGLKQPLPAVWEAVPALWRGDLLAAVPHIGWVRPGIEDVPLPVRFEFVGPERDYFG